MNLEFTLEMKKFRKKVETYFTQEKVETHFTQEKVEALITQEKWEVIFRALLNVDLLTYSKGEFLHGFLISPYG